MNNVILIGRLTKDPELRYIPSSGTPVTTFTLAIDRDYVKKDGNKDTDFIPVEVIGKMAEPCATYLTKGRMVAILGSIRVNRYETQDGEKKTFTKVNAKQVQFIESNKNKSNQEANQPTFEPNFDVPEGLDPNAFTAIDDEDIPF